MRKITKKFFVHISQTDNIIILIMGLTHLDNQVLDSDIIIEGFETPSRKDRDSRGGGIITYHKSCVNLTRRLDLEHRVCRSEPGQRSPT
jgi:hypothetical protein